MNHLQQIGFDHRSIHLAINLSKQGSKKQSLFYIDAWSEHQDFHRVVTEAWYNASDIKENITRHQEACKVWNRDVFGHIDNRNCRLLAWIRGVEKGMENM
ncbi:hypothetical protein V6N13_029949 [Hibiscus sabdariffa]